LKIAKINLVNFRNYANININLGDKLNIFVGNNAAGKTNILESIVILALTKSYRLGVNPNIIMFNKDKTKIKGVIKNNKIVTKLEIEVTNDYKKLKVNQNYIKKVALYIANLNVIVFTPDDLEIIKGSPNIRRNLLNMQLSQLTKIYLNTYNEYNKILKTRNEYLKLLFTNSLQDKKYLDILTDKLIEKAIIIYQKRREYLDLINENINNIYKFITNDNDLRVEYVPNINLKDYSDEEIRKELSKKFKFNYQKELSYGMTLYGPHRDDYNFILKDSDLKYFGSEGQKKVAILAFKLAEINIFKNITGTNPVLLLDDIFSELDINKRKKLLSYVDSDIQTIITTTDLKNINKKYLDNAKVFLVKNNMIMEQGGKKDDC
jgi:DNA replication and repair protein RecF